MRPRTRPSVQVPLFVAATVIALALGSLGTAVAAPALTAGKVKSIAAKVVNRPRPGKRFLTPLGLVAGFLDASGGGGWGPVATSTLLASGRLEPRKVVGSVSTSEFVVAVAASVGFLFSLSQEPLDWTTILALMVGGMIAAPFAAYQG